MDDMMSATVMIKTDFPRNKRSLQIAAAKWFLPVPGFPEKIKLAMFPLKFFYILAGEHECFHLPLTFN